MRADRFDLTTGSIVQKLFMVAVPLMGTSFLQMTYNLANMFWLGHLNSGLVAASGSVGMYLWLTMAFLVLGRMGTEIGVSQSFGRGDVEKARAFAQNSFVLNLVLGVVIAVIMFVFRAPLMSFFNLQDPVVIRDAENYMAICSFGVPMTFATAVMTSAFNGSGNSRLPFWVNFLGVAINLVLDPITIIVLGWGIVGAGITTVFAQTVVCLTLVFCLAKSKVRPFAKFSFFTKPDLTILRQIMKWGMPVALESLLFCFLSMIITRMVAGYGIYPVASMRVGSQIESLTWLISGGFATALTTFIGQNYGAKETTRIRRGMGIAFSLMSTWGLIITLVMLFGGELIMALFLREPEAIAYGMTYLKILAICQIPGSIEGITSGFLRGVGRTLPPSIVSIVCNALRVPFAYALSMTSLGLNGLWLGFCIGAVMRGVVLLIVYLMKKEKAIAI